MLFYDSLEATEKKYSLYFSNFNDNLPIENV